MFIILRLLLDSSSQYVFTDACLVFIRRQHFSFSLDNIHISADDHILMMCLTRQLVQQIILFYCQGTVYPTLSRQYTFSVVFLYFFCHYISLNFTFLTLFDLPWCFQPFHALALFLFHFGNGILFSLKKKKFKQLFERIYHLLCTSVIFFNSYMASLPDSLFPRGSAHGTESLSMCYTYC